MTRSKRGPSLFEVMNKTPVAANPRRQGFSWRWNRDAAARLQMAEALTEEEAAAAIAEERAKQEKKSRRRSGRRRALAGADGATTSSLREGETDRRTESAGDGQVRARDGRLVFSLTTAACVAVAGVMCAALLGAYAMGRRSTGGAEASLSPVAALGNGTFSGGSPLLPSARPLAATPKEEPPPIDPDLSQLLKRPEPPESSVGANRPARVDGVAASPAATISPAGLNYLQIESFLITRERSGEALAKDVSEVRRYLSDHAIRTFARRRSNGYVLFAEQGFPPSKEFQKEREEFAKRIAELGRAYRKSGGQYEFKGCFFVGYQSTQAGDPD